LGDLGWELCATFGVTFCAFEQVFGQMPWMLPTAPAAAAPQEESSTSDEVEASARKYVKDDTAALTTSATVLIKLPRKRILQVLESAAPEVLDATVTANLDLETVGRLIYIFTRIRPLLHRTSKSSAKQITLAKHLTLGVGNGTPCAPTTRGSLAIPHGE
jgi:hypothetical protein